MSDTKRARYTLEFKMEAVVATWQVLGSSRPIADGRSAAFVGLEKR